MFGLICIYTSRIFVQCNAWCAELKGYSNNPAWESTNPLTLDMPVKNMGVVPDRPTSLGIVNAESIISSLVGIPAIPQKIVQRILAGDYVNIAELCPDSWHMDEVLFQ